MKPLTQPTPQLSGEEAERFIAKFLNTPTIGREKAIEKKQREIEEILKRIQEKP